MLSFPGIRDTWRHIEAHIVEETGPGGQKGEAELFVWNLERRQENGWEARIIAVGSGAQNCSELTDWLALE